MIEQRLIVVIDDDGRQGAESFASLLVKWGKDGYWIATDSLRIATHSDGFIFAAIVVKEADD